MKFPPIKEVALELRQINANVEGPCDVRLQIYPDGQWAVRWGLPDYDQDHRGYWGASSVPGVVKGRVSRFRSRELAKDLIEECRDAYAEDQADLAGM